MSYEHEGERLRVFIGDTLCPDDPRGREAAVHFEFGLPTGEFDPPKYIHDLPTRVWGGGPGPNIGRGRNPDYKEYGTWGFSITLWRWGISFGIRGPVLGSWPESEDDPLYDEAERLK
jgi:hypothetical protein